MIDLAEILKEFLGKENFKLRCELVEGFVYLHEIKENGDIVVKTKQDDLISLDQFGRLIGNTLGRCLLWPDTHRDWAALKNNEKPKYTHIQDLGIKLEELADYELSHLTELISNQMRKNEENQETEIEEGCQRILNKFNKGQKTFWSTKYSGEKEFITIKNILWEDELEKERGISQACVYFDVIEIDKKGNYESWTDCMTVLRDLIPYKDLDEKVMEEIVKTIEYYLEKTKELRENRARDLKEIVKDSGIS